MKKCLLTFTIFVCIVLVTFLQYGYFNITNLGLIGDDWDIMRPVYMNKKGAFGEYFEYQFSKGLVSLERPFWVTVVPLENFLFRDNLYFYHLLSAFMYVISAFLLYLCMGKQGLDLRASFICSLFFLCLPNHVASLYWIAGQLSLFSFMCGLLGWYFLLSKNFVLHYVFSVIFLFVSFINYENILALFATIILFEALSFKRTKKVKKHFLFLLPIFITLFSFWFYRKVYLYNYLDVTPYKSPNFGFSFKSVYQRFELFSSHLYGPTFFLFLANFFQNFYRIYHLRNIRWVLLLSFLSIGFVFLRFISLKRSSEKMQKSVNRHVFSFGFVLLAFSFIVLLPTYREYDLGTLSDRVNLITALALVMILGSFLNFASFFRQLQLVFPVLILMTLINWTYLSSFIESYETQLAFIEESKKMDLKENSLFFVDTDALETNGIVTLNRSWAFTHMISSSTGIHHIEYVGNGNDYDLYRYDGYESRYYKGYVYENPNLFLINFRN